MLSHGSVLDAGQLRDDKETKPAGQLSDFRTFAALTSIREHVHLDFEHMSALFLGSLLMEGHLYKERVSGKVFLCLGFVLQTALLFEVEAAAESWLAVGSTL